MHLTHTIHTDTLYADSDDCETRAEDGTVSSDALTEIRAIASKALRLEGGSLRSALRDILLLCGPAGRTFTGVDAGSVRELVRLVRHLDAARGGNNLVSLVNLRAALAAEGLTDRVKQDLLLSLARRAGKVSLSALEGRHGVNPAEAEAAVREDGTLLGFISLREGV